MSYAEYQCAISALKNILLYSFSLTNKFMYLAKNIRKFRKLSGLSLEELARKVECSKNYIFEIETGKKNNPTFKLVPKIANALNVTVDQLARLVDHARIGFQFKGFWHK